MEDKWSVLVEIYDIRIVSTVCKSNFDLQIGKSKASRGFYLLRGFG